MTGETAYKLVLIPASLIDRSETDIQFGTASVTSPGPFEIVGDVGPDKVIRVSRPIYDAIKVMETMTTATVQLADFDYRTIDRVRELAALHGTDAIRVHLTAAGLMNASSSDEQVYSIAFGTMRSWATDLADLADRLAGAHRICTECRHVYRTPEDLQREWTANAPPDLPARETPPAAEQIYFCPLCQHDF